MRAEVLIRGGGGRRRGLEAGPIDDTASAACPGSGPVRQPGAASLEAVLAVPGQAAAFPLVGPDIVVAPSCRIGTLAVPLQMVVRLQEPSVSCASPLCKALAAPSGKRNRVAAYVLLRLAYNQCASLKGRMLFEPTSM